MKKNLKFILLSFFALLLFSCGTILLTHDLFEQNDYTEVLNDETKADKTSSTTSIPVYNYYENFSGTGELSSMCSAEYYYTYETGLFASSLAKLYVTLSGCDIETAPDGYGKIDKIFAIYELSMSKEISFKNGTYYIGSLDKSLAFVSQISIVLKRENYTTLFDGNGGTISGTKNGVTYSFAQSAGTLKLNGTLSDSINPFITYFPSSIYDGNTFNIAVTKTAGSVTGGGCFAFDLRGDEDVNLSNRIYCDISYSGGSADLVYPEGRTEYIDRIGLWLYKSDGQSTTFNNAEYNISIKRNSSTAKFANIISAKKSVEYGVTYNDLPTPTRNGYTFDGWNTDEYGTGTKVVNNSTMPDLGDDGEEITLYAKWIPNDYKITLNKQGGSGGTDYVIERYDDDYYLADGTALGSKGGLFGRATGAPISIPTRTGYRFGGYFTETNGNGKKFIQGYNDDYSGYFIWGYVNSYGYDTYFKSDGTLYAKWVPNTYTVKYLGNGNTSGSTASSTHTYDVAKNLTANGFKREYTITYDLNYTGSTNTTKTVAASFNGWSCDKGGTYNNKQSVTNLTSTNGDTVTMTAQWSFGSITHTSPSRTGYTFSGWYKEASCTNKVADTLIVTSDDTFYAKWTANRYKLTLNINGATSGSNQDVYAEYDSSTIYTASTGATVASITNPTRNGYKFKGWTITKDGNDILIDTSKVLTYIEGKDYTNSSKTWKKTAGVTLYAKWEANVMTIKYHLNGGNIVSGNTYFEQTDPARTETWAYNKENTYGLTNPSSDRVTKTGYYANTIYYNTQADGKGNNVSFKGSTEGGDGTKLDKATDIANAAGELSNFNTGDITIDLYFIWILTQYSITYDSESIKGATVSPANNTSYTIESTTFTLHNPVKQGYIFSGWTGSNGTTPQTTVTITKGSTGNKTFTANWLETWASENSEGKLLYGVEPTTDAEGIFIVDSAEKLAWVANKVNFNNNNAISVKLTNNINLADHEWYPIGTQERPYCGEFNGNGYQITNLTTDARVNDGYAGLLGCIGSKVVGQNIAKANIHNVSISGATINGKFAGGIVGYAKAGTISNNIVYNSTINGTENTGGIVGKANDGVKIDSNLFSGTLSGTTKGLVSGNFNGTISNCVGINTGTGTLTLKGSGDGSNIVNSLKKNGKTEVLVKLIDPDDKDNTTTTSTTIVNNSGTKIDNFNSYIPSGWKAVGNMFISILPSTLFWIAS